MRKVLGDRLRISVGRLALLNDDLAVGIFAPELSAHGAECGQRRTELCRRNVVVTANERPRRAVETLTMNVPNGDLAVDNLVAPARGTRLRHDVGYGQTVDGRRRGEGLRGGQWLSGR